MNFSWLYLFDIAVAIVLLFFLNPRFIGLYGEKVIAYKLSKLNNDKYKVINDLFFENDGKSTQIDHIVISKYGIFVIELKNYGGWIYGDDYVKNWTVVYQRGRKEKLYNPVRQNFGHMKAIEKVLSEYRNLKFIPIIVFSTRANLKHIKSGTTVVSSTGLIDNIKKYKNEILTTEKVDSIYDKLNSINVTDKQERKILRKEHINIINGYKNK